MHGYIKESHQGGVYSRLYLDSTVRRKKLENIEKQVSTTETVPKSRTKIENTLMLKHAKSQAKLNTLRYTQQLKETQGITGVPKINKISKEIVQVKEGESNEPVSLYTAKLLNSSRSSSVLKITPKQSFLSLIELKKANESGKTGKIIKLLEEKKNEQDESQFIPQEYAAVQAMKGSCQSKEEDIQNIRKAVFEKCKVPEPPAQKKSLLNMSVLERNSQWLENKKERLSQNKERFELEETSGCTFSPKLNPRIEIGHGRNQSLSRCMSYMEIHRGKDVNYLQLSQKTETPLVKGSFSRPYLYKPISPHERASSQYTSLKLLEKARPMAHYLHCGGG